MASNNGRGRSPGRRATDLVKDPEAWVEQEAKQAILVWAPIGSDMWEASIWVAGRKRWWETADHEFYTDEEIARVEAWAKRRFGAREKSILHPRIERRPERA